MERRTRFIIGGALAVAIVAGIAGVGVAASGGDDDAPLTGSALDKAKTAALEATGGGTVTETEVGDDGAVYGVEIRLEDGSQVEVNLDEGFNVIGQDAYDDRLSDHDGAGDND